MDMYLMSLDEEGMRNMEDQQQLQAASPFLLRPLLSHRGGDWAESYPFHVVPNT